MALIGVYGIKTVNISLENSLNMYKSFLKEKGFFYNKRLIHLNQPLRRWILLAAILAVTIDVGNPDGENDH